MTDAASVPADAEPPPASGWPLGAPEAGGTSTGVAGGTPEDPTAAGAVLAPTGVDRVGRPWPPFAHGSEAEMARILDFYEVRWDYEPRTFPILWNLEGDVVESFSPDFYLPDLDLFLEMTTLKQRLVRKKNRKLRRLRELYPDVRIKLFYARDFRAMMLKYGRLALAASLSGTLGQVMPDRGRDVDLEIEAIVALEAPLGTPDAADALADPPLPPSLVVALPDAPAAAEDAPASRRRNASRSRRRRAAAAARSATRAGRDGAGAPPDAEALGPAQPHEEDSARR